MVPPFGAAARPAAGGRAAAYALSVRRQTGESLHWLDDTVPALFLLGLIAGRVLRSRTLSPLAPGQRTQLVSRFDHYQVYSVVILAALAVAYAVSSASLVRQWLLGPDGWTMPGCTIDLVPGGRYRYEWLHLQRGTRMGMGGEFLEVAPPERFVASELFDDAWYPGVAVSTTTFTERDGRTHVAIRMRYESPAARDAAKFSGMERGMAAGFDRVETLLPRWQGKVA